MKRLQFFLSAGCMSLALLTGCGTAAEAPVQAQEEAAVLALEDGVYRASFDTDSSMFHVNEAYEGKGILTVENGEMTIHVSLAGTGIKNLFAGLAEDAQKEGAVLLEPTEDEVLYGDGTTEIVYGYDIPVPYLDEEFDVALIGSKEKWYDHKVSVSDAEPLEPEAEKTVSAELENGVYMMDVALTGGTKKASVESPARVEIRDTEMVATIVWSSPNYDYMIVNGEKYLPLNTEGNSTFEIPVSALDEEIPVTADTVAMSTPHEIEYTLKFDSGSAAAVDESD